MVEYLYKDTYWNPPSLPNYTSPSYISASMLDVMIFQIADKYDIPGLARAASAKFKTSATAEYDRLDFPDTIRELYQNGPDNAIAKSMQDLIVELLIGLGGQAISEPKRTELRKVVQECPVFGIAFQKASLEAETKRQIELMFEAKQDLEASMEIAAKLKRQEQAISNQAVNMEQSRKASADRKAWMEAEEDHQDRLQMLKQQAATQQRVYLQIEKDHAATLLRSRLEHQSYLARLTTEHIASLDKLSKGQKEDQAQALTAQQAELNAVRKSSIVKRRLKF